MLVQYGGNKPAVAMKALATCAGLRHLELRFRTWALELLSHAASTSLTRIPGFKNLLKIRGINKLTIVQDLLDDDDDYFDPSYKTNWEILVQALQVLKEPQSKLQVTLQDKKDFPEEARKKKSGSAKGPARSQMLVKSKAWAGC